MRLRSNELFGWLGFRDDHPSNIQATHYWCNGEKGSTRIE